MLYIMISTEADLDRYMETQSCKTKLSITKLHGHTRSITSISFIKDSLIITTSKENTPMLWDYKLNKRLAIMEGHIGAVLCSTSNNNDLIVTGSADQSICIWNIEGKLLNKIEHEARIRDMYMSVDNKLVVTTDNMFGETPSILVYQISDDGLTYTMETRKEINVKINKVILSKDNKYIYFCTEDGHVCILNLNDNTTVSKIIHLNASCKTLKLDPNEKMLLTGSNDKTSKLLSIKDLSIISVYTSSCPINDVISVDSNVKEHVVVAGGIDAANVTTSNDGKFDITFYSKTLEDRLGSFTTHFGPINCLDITKDSKSFASGGEDGFVYIYTFDDKYIS